MQFANEVKSGVAENCSWKFNQIMNGTFNFVVRTRRNTTVFVVVSSKAKELQATCAPTLHSGLINSKHKSRWRMYLHNLYICSLIIIARCAIRQNIVVRQREAILLPLKFDTIEILFEEK